MKTKLTVLIAALVAALITSTSFVAAAPQNQAASPPPGFTQKVILPQQPFEGTGENVWSNVSSLGGTKDGVAWVFVDQGWYELKLTGVCQNIPAELNDRIKQVIKKPRDNIELVVYQHSDCGGGSFRVFALLAATPIPVVARAADQSAVVTNTVTLSTTRSVSSTVIMVFRVKFATYFCISNANPALKWRAELPVLESQVTPDTITITARKGGFINQAYSCRLEAVTQ